MQYIIVFLIWLLLLYIIHRAVHHLPILKIIHYDHHRYISHFKGNNWHWTNLLLYNDTWLSTVDLWITEVVPTLLFCFITEQWWISLFYYCWAAFLQEVIEHNPKINLYPFLTSGKWHLEHHQSSKCNFGLLFPIFDILFSTNKYNTYENPENR
jgi:sterol desaturase/sphingolipid hydroxylase (fatty acid hydroxylase superfamily)